MRVVISYQSPDIYPANANNLCIQLRPRISRLDCQVFKYLNSMWRVPSPSSFPLIKAALQHPHCKWLKVVCIRRAFSCASFAAALILLLFICLQIVSASHHWFWYWSGAANWRRPAEFRRRSWAEYFVACIQVVKVDTLVVRILSSFRFFCWRLSFYRTYNLMTFVPIYYRDEFNEHIHICLSI